MNSRLRSPLRVRAGGSSTRPPIPGGPNAVYRVTADDDGGQRRAILKCHRPAPVVEFTSLAEARITEIVRRETGLPVPRVLGTCRSHDAVPTPLVLYEAVEGVDARRAGVLEDSGLLEPFARAAGRHLARIHAFREFERFGRLEPVDGDLVVGDGHDAWDAYVRGIVERDLEYVHETRFRDLESRLRDGLDALVGDLDADPAPVFTHGDYAPDNLLVRPETAEITGIVDWERAAANDRVHELAATEIYVSNWAPADSSRRGRVREALLAGYGSESTWSPSAYEDADRRALSEFAVWVMAMRWFDVWHADVAEPEAEAFAAAHRAAVSAVLDE